MKNHSDSPATLNQNPLCHQLQIPKPDNLIQHLAKDRLYKIGFY